MDTQPWEVLDRWGKVQFTGTQKECCEWTMTRDMTTSGRRRKEFKFRKVEEVNDKN